MNDIECKRCGWGWILFEGRAEDDCPLCPDEPGLPLFVSGTTSGAEPTQNLAITPASTSHFSQKVRVLTTSMTESVLRPVRLP